MKYILGKPVNWFGPYQLAELLCFWVKKETDEYGFKRTKDWVHKFGEFLAYGSVKKDTDVFLFTDDRKETVLYRFLSWIHSKRKRTNIIKIDKWDTWSMDETLAPIILQLLKQLKETKHGSAIVEMGDVPEYLRTTHFEKYENQQCFDFYHEGENEYLTGVHERWDWVMDEMIHAFDRIVDDSWEDQYRSGEMDTIMEPCSFDANGKPSSYIMKDGPNNTYECDYVGLQKEHDRINNGLRLFGKYFRGLWD